VKPRTLSRTEMEMKSRVFSASRLRQAALAGMTLSLFGLSGCHNDMWIQPKMKPQFQSDFFPDQQANRPLVPHSVARSQFWTDSERYTGYSTDNKIATTFPFKITVQDIKRGQDRFNIYCAPCHGALGNGQGMIALRGLALRRPVGNYHTEKLLKAPVGHFYDVITNGFGTMYSYASRIEPDDRWRIVAYIKALQRSQAAKPEDIDRSQLSPAALKQIDSAPAEPVAPTGATPAPGEMNNGANGAPVPPADVRGTAAPAGMHDAPVNETPAAKTGSSTRTENAPKPTDGAAPTSPETAPAPAPANPGATAPNGTQTKPSAGGVNGTNR